MELGCGTGALTEAIVARCAPARVLGLDPSEGFLAEARRNVGDPRVEFRRGDARIGVFGDSDVGSTNLFALQTGATSPHVATNATGLLPSTVRIAAIIMFRAGPSSQIASATFGVLPS